MEHQSKVKSGKAYAKINLTLEVIGNREDGYHEIASVVQVINLCDILSFQPREHIYLACNIPQLVSPNNLVFKAARLLQDFTGSSDGVAISLEKAIPLASGLGGGSSDAAVTLSALNEIWGLHLAPENLERIAANLGSDISFFLSGGMTALVEGRGEEVTRLPPLPKTWVVLVKPPIEVANKTQKMYASLDPSHFTQGKSTQKVVELIKRGDRITSQFCYNVFNEVAFSFFPGLDEYRLRFLAAGASQVHLAGTGPTLFTLAQERTQGEEICRRLKKERIEVYLTETL
jgi:4-diphosphocytidyl-2-C-methyl-D-erythritol kinase